MGWLKRPKEGKGRPIMEWSTSMALGVKNKSETKGWKRTIDSASVQIRCDLSLSFLYERYEPWQTPRHVDIGSQSKELYLVLSVDWGYGWKWGTW